MPRARHPTLLLVPTLSLYQKHPLSGRCEALGSEGPAGIERSTTDMERETDFGLRYTRPWLEARERIVAAINEEANGVFKVDSHDCWKNGLWARK